MLTEEKQVLAKLYSQIRLFDNYIKEKDYLRAALCVDNLRDVALGIGLDEAYMAEIFGDRHAQEPAEGLINEADYLKACGWCIFHGYENNHSTLKNLMEIM